MYSITKIMSSSSEDISPSSPEGMFVARQPIDWLTKSNIQPSPSETITFKCPYTLRKIEQFQYKNQLWTIGDIASLTGPKSKKVIYAQIIELFQNSFCEKRAKIMWLAPKLNIQVTDEDKKVHYDNFKPNDFVHICIDKRLVPLHCLVFVMNVPNQFEYKKYIGTAYLVNTKILSHAERYAESDEDDGPKSKSKVRRLLNK